MATNDEIDGFAAWLPEPDLGDLAPDCKAPPKVFGIDRWDYALRLYATQLIGRADALSLFNLYGEGAAGEHRQDSRT